MVKILPVLYSTNHALQFHMPHDYVPKNLNFDPLTPLPGPQSDPRVKILLVVYSTHYPLRIDMQHDYVLKNFN